MSFGLPSLRTKSCNPAYTECREGSYGIPDVMVTGLAAPIDKIGPVHPVQSSVRSRSEFEQRLNMNIMRDIQGIHAPLRLAMELQSFKHVGRLQFLPSSNLSTDVLQGRDDYIDFTDVLYPPEVHERLSQPHAIMEKMLGIL